MSSYRCQKCGAIRVIACDEVQLESYCRDCEDDTKWVVEELSGGGHTFADPESTFDMNSKVKLRVGGVLYRTTVATLLLRDREDSMFGVLFSNAFSLDHDNGAVVIDRPSKWFSAILDYCRIGELSEVPHLGAEELSELKEEAGYYCLKGLVDIIETQQDRMQALAEEGFTKTVDEILLLQNDVTSRLQALHDSKQALYVRQASSATLRDSTLYVIHSLEASLAEAKRLLHTDPLSPTRQRQLSEGQ